MKHVKTFEQYSLYIDNEIINEEFLGFGDKIKKSIDKIDSLENKSDEEIRNLFMEVFEKTKSTTNISVNHWKYVEKQINENKISKEKMIDLLNKIKEDFSKNKKHGYLVYSQGQVLYKFSTSMKTSVGNSPSHG